MGLSFDGHWPDMRCRELYGRLAALLDRQNVRFSLMPSPAADGIDYFPARDLFDRDLTAYAPEPFRYVRWADVQSGAATDVVIVTAHGDDRSQAIWEARRQIGPEAVIATWHWDNHLSWPNNMRTVLATDLIFPSHGHPDVTTYLHGPASVLAGHVPLCSAQWARLQEDELRQCVDTAQRRHKAIVNYVDYGYEWNARSRLLRTYAAELAEADVLLMPPDDRSRYFGQPTMERFAEWARFKATVIVPLRDDLSTRVFDALLAGVIPVIPRSIPDLDRAIPPPVRQQLGIVDVESLELDAVQPAVCEALARFDDMGHTGVIARHRFALENHMLVNRVTEILYHVWRLASGAQMITFDDGPAGPALYTRPSET